MPGALEGVRVIDFGQYIAGPLAAVMLADQGAEVVHVDPPGGPLWRSPADAFYQRGKRRVALDLKSDEGRETARRLIGGADVVIENFRPGVMDRLGVGAVEMTQQNPRLVYCSIPGFAADDPRAGLRAWEGVIHAATENCIPRVGEEPPEWDWSRPFFSAVPLASNFAAFLGATAIVMALVARERTGKGQHIEAPLFDAMFTLIGHSGAWLDSRGWKPPSGIHGRGAGAFRCADGRYVQFDTSSARHLTWFARAAGITDTWDPELLDMSRNRDPEVNERLHAALRELFLTRTAEEWERIGNEAGGSIGVARPVAEWIANEHARQTRAVTQLQDPEFGPTWMAGLPVHLDGTPGAPRGPRELPSANGASALADEAAPATASRNGAGESIGHPLQGFKVLDICLALAGPTCGRLLLEFGADTIKISPPHRGVGSYLNRGKRSLLLDLDSIEGQEIFLKLAEQADVVVENLSPGTADRLGIGYEEVKARRPDIVYTSISAYGPGGPMSRGRGWERQGQAVSGVMERASDPPSVLGPYNLVDHGTGALGTFATALGLYHRARTGQGQHVFASLAQTGTYHQTPYMLSFDGYEATEPRGYEALGRGPLYRFYRASDRWFFLAAIEGDETRVASAEGLDGIDVDSADPEAELERRFSGESAETWVQRLTAAGVPAHVHVTVEELMGDPVVRAQGLSITQEIEGQGTATMPGVPVRMHGTPMRVGAPSRRPGSDAPAILEEIGMGDRLEALERSWVVQASDLPAAW
jgi:crotonobetainyl-CoA:carnitine CoA-transferase CaiB-like acyl-CoA transferase